MKNGTRVNTHDGIGTIKGIEAKYPSFTRYKVLLDIQPKLWAEGQALYYFDHELTVIKEVIKEEIK